MTEEENGTNRFFTFEQALEMKLIMKIYATIQSIHTHRAHSSDYGGMEKV